MALVKRTRDARRNSRQALPTLASSDDLARLRQTRMRELDREFLRQTRELRRVTKAFGVKIKHL